MSIDILIFYFRMFYFLRIFDSTAPFVKAITQIVFDSRVFLMVFFIAICAFGFAFWILSNDAIYKEDVIIDSTFDAMMYSYLISLGEFGMDSFEESRDFEFLWLMFILATFFSMLILLNMLIAIMSESFTRI